MVVSTPQDIALIDAVKGVNMFKKVDVPVCTSSPKSREAAADDDGIGYEYRYWAWCRT